MKRIRRSFLGTGWSFPPEYDESLKAFKLVSEEKDIRESLYIILSTIPGERVMRPEFGCALHKFVFESLDLSTITYIKDLIATAVLNYEPRITLDDIYISSRDSEKGIIDIELNYVIRATNSRSNMVYPFYHQEGTNLTDR